MIRKKNTKSCACKLTWDFVFSYFLNSLNDYDFFL